MTGRISLIFFFSVFFIVHSLSAQEITVLDSVNRTPIRNAFLFQKSESVTTDKKGKADISSFSENEPFMVQHPSYYARGATKKDLRERGYVLYLRESQVNLKEVTIHHEGNEKQDPVTRRKARISSKDIEFSNPQTSADALGSSGEVFIQKSQMGGGSPMIRGFAANRVLLLVDGIRMNNAIFRGGNLQNVISLDPSFIDNADVLFGPGSLNYGSDAIGGAFRFTTLEPWLRWENNDRYQVGTVTRYSSANQEKTGGFHFRYAGKKWATVTAFSYSEFGDLRMGRHGRESYLRKHYQERRNGNDVLLKNENPHIQRPSAYSQWSGMQKVLYSPGEKMQIEYAFHYSSTSNIPRYDRLIEFSGEEPRNAEWHYGPQQWMMHRLSAKYRTQHFLADRIEVNTAYQNFGESRHVRGWQEDLRRSTYEDVRAGNINLDAFKKVTERLDLHYGLQLTENRVYSKGESVDILSGERNSMRSRYPDGSAWSSYGAFITAGHTLTEHWDLTGGLRFDHVRMNMDLDTSAFPLPFDHIAHRSSNLTASLGITGNTGPHTRLNGNISTGFRAPNIDDAGKVFDSEPGSLVIPNDDLQSEYVSSAEAGILRNFGGFLQAELTLFVSYMYNAISRRPDTYFGQTHVNYRDTLSRVQSMQNVDRATVYGTQFDFSVRLSKHWAWETDLTWMQGEEYDAEGGRYPLRHATPFFGRSHIRYKKNKFKSDLFTEWNGEVPYANMPLSERNKTHMYASDEKGHPFSPSWMTLNFRASYQFNRHLNASVGLDNILDRSYRPYASGIAAPGRNFIFALRTSFY